MNQRTYPIRFLFFPFFVIALLLACDIALPGFPSISKAVLAKDFKSDSGTPIDETAEYAPEQNKFHLIVTMNDAKETTFKSVWTAVDVGGTTPIQHETRRELPLDYWIGNV